MLLRYEFSQLSSVCYTMCWSIGIVIGFLAVGISAGDDQPVVTTPLGLVSGFYDNSPSGRRYRAFEGIPYGKPPIGELRFEPPRAFGSWPDTLVARNKNTSCVQYHHSPGVPPAERVGGNEDCLFINIYTSAAENSSKLFPVVFDIHGGAFQFGEGNRRAENFMDRDLVVVTANYRLGPLGFLSTEDEVVPGNMGLKDQNLAIRWVSENIESFGGDPKKITLTGTSAGGASVHYHYLSPLSRGLFYAGISVSGTGLDCWTQTEASKEKAEKLAAALGCPTENSRDLVNCLKSKPARSIIERISDFMPWLYNPFTPFGPVAEVPTNHTFIDRPPIDIITSGDAADVPWLTSVTSEEGLYPAAEFVADEQLMEQLDTNWERIAPHLLDYNYTLPRSEHASTANRIREHYLGNSKINRSTALPLIHMIGDRLYHVDGGKAARLMARANKSPVWFYFYNYRAEISISDFFLPKGEDFGVSHSDDSLLLFPSDTFNTTLGEDTLKVTNLLLDMWSTFAANGSPNITDNWPAVDPNSEALEYLVISGPRALTVRQNDNFGQKSLWESLGVSENKPKKPNNPVDSKLK